MVGNKDKSVEKAEHYSKLADEFTLQVTDFMLDNHIPHNAEIDKLCLEYMMSSMGYIQIRSSMYIDTDMLSGENK